MTAFVIKICIPYQEHFVDEIIKCWKIKKIQFLQKYQNDVIQYSYAYKGEIQYTTVLRD